MRLNLFIVAILLGVSALRQANVLLYRFYITYVNVSNNVSHRSKNIYIYIYPGFSLRRNVIYNTNFIHPCTKYKIDNYKRAQMNIKEIWWRAGTRLNCLRVSFRSDHPKWLKHKSLICDKRVTTQNL